MTLKRLFLVFLTIAAIVLVVADLLSSWNEPQFQSRLELSQTDLRLQAAQVQDGSKESSRQSETVEKSALETYQKTRVSVAQAIETARSQLKDPDKVAPLLKTQLAEQEKLQDELDLRIGLLQAQRGEPDAAIKTWEPLSGASENSGGGTSTIVAIKPTQGVQATADVLVDLWRDRLPPRAEPILKQNLNGWFRFRALEKLYTEQQRSSALTELRAEEQRSAQQALTRWIGINALPTIAILSGAGLIIFLVGQWLIKRKQAILAGTNDITWSVPWDAETVWQVLVVGFFAVGQLLLPLAIRFALTQFSLDPTGFTVRQQAIQSLIVYVLLAAGGLGVLYASIRQFLPLPEGWFRFSLRGNWFLWGLGGYLAAYPFVAGVSWVNEQIWQGRGGSNPLLPIALQGGDPTAIILFLITASIAAPLFEETFFRGFLLPSLTRYFTTWQAILLSSLLFAIVHLSLSEVIPLTTLGIMLGFVYTRTQNLMASVLLHSLWNSGTLLTLFLLGNTTV